MMAFRSSSSRYLKQTLINYKKVVIDYERLALYTAMVRALIRSARRAPP